MEPSLDRLISPPWITVLLHYADLSVFFFFFDIILSTGSVNIVIFVFPKRNFIIVSVIRNLGRKPCSSKEMMSRVTLISLVTLGNIEGCSVTWVWLEGPAGAFLFYRKGNQKVRVRLAWQ